MAIRCPICKGTKKCIGLGNLLKDCKACQGIGFVKDDETPPLVAHIASVIAADVIADVKEDKQDEVIANGKAERKAERKAK